MSESNGDTTTVTPGWRVAGSCKHKVRQTCSEAQIIGWQIIFHLSMEALCTKHGLELPIE